MHRELIKGRKDTITAACAEEAPTDNPFTLNELDGALLHRFDSAPCQLQITYSMPANLGASGKTALLELFNLSLEAETQPAVFQEPLHLFKSLKTRLKWQLGELHPNTTICLLTLLGAFRSRSGLVFLDLEKGFELESPLAMLEVFAEKGSGDDF